MTDVIRRTGSIKGRNVSETGSRIAARPSTPPQVLHGARSSSVQLTQLLSGQTLYQLGKTLSSVLMTECLNVQITLCVFVPPIETDSDKALSSLQFVSDSVFLASCSDGSVYVADTRTSAAPQLLPPPPPSDESVLWWTDTSAAPQHSDCKLVRLSSSGRAVVSDSRSSGGVVCQAQLDIQTRPDELKDVTVSWAPTLDGYVSVSGRSLI